MKPKIEAKKDISSEAMQAAVAAKTSDALGKRNPSDNGELNNAAVVNQIGEIFSGAGLLDIEKPDSKENRVNKDTMFAEGSIGKVRFAGLAYMLEQEGVFGAEGLQQNARKFFRQRVVGDFLESRYPGKNLQAAIVSLFTGGSDKATLADLTTHRSGIGDTTRDGLAIIQARGIETALTLPDLILPQPESKVPRDIHGKPAAQKGPHIQTSELTAGKYGDHEYSNLGYQILAAAMEAAYFINRGVAKDYQQLTEDFMLRPIEGRAKDGGLRFDRSKFPKDLQEDENVIQAKFIEKKEGKDVVSNPNKCSAANAAGGMFSSADDSAKFFAEYFKGFPGTKEYGVEDANKFFTKETIARMEKEARKHDSHANQATIDARKAELQEWQKRNDDQKETSQDPKPIIPNPELQFPGVVAMVDQEMQPTKYVKGGGTPGYISRLEFDPETGDASISMINQENLTSQKEKLAAKKDGWVEKLGLEKDAEKPKSFAAAAKVKKDEDGLIQR